MYITQIFGRPLEKAIEFNVHIQSDIGGRILYVADLGVGRGFISTGKTFDDLIKNIMILVNTWRAVVFDDQQNLISNEEDLKVIRSKVKEWYGIK